MNGDGKTMNETLASAGPQDPPRGRISAGRKLAFTALVLLLLLGFAEGGLRLAYFVYRGSWTFIGSLGMKQRLYTPHPYTAYQLVPNIEAATYQVLLHTNRWGNRGPDQPYEKPPGTVRIVTLGGSTTFNVFASDDAHTWPAQLERLLNEHYGTDRIEVVNYAVAGYNSAESLTTFALRAIDRDPDIVVVHHGWNDITPATEPGFRSDYTHRRKAGVNKVAPWWARLAVYRVSLVLRGRRARSIKPAGTAEGLSPRAVAVYERNLESIILLAKPRGIEPVLVTLATRLSPDNDPEGPARAAHTKHRTHKDRLTPAGLFRAVKANNDCMRRLAEQYGCLLVDLGIAYPRDEANFLAGDFGHKTDAGLELFARLVAEAMIREGLVARALAAPQGSTDRDG